MITTYILVAIQLLSMIFVCMRVIMRQLPVSTTYTWLGLVIFIPFLGIIWYLIIGERHIGTLVVGS